MARNMKNFIYLIGDRKTREVCGMNLDCEYDVACILSNLNRTHAHVFFDHGCVLFSVCVRVGVRVCTSGSRD